MSWTISFSTDVHSTLSRIASPNLSTAFDNLCRNVSDPVDSILQVLLSSPPVKLFDLQGDDDLRNAASLQRLAATLLAAVDSAPGTSFPLLNTLIGQHLLQLLPSFSGPVTAVDKVKIRILANVLGSALTAARELETQLSRSSDASQVDRMTSRLVKLLTMAKKTSKVQGRHKRAVTGLSVFISQMTSNESLVAICPDLSSLDE